MSWSSLVAFTHSHTLTPSVSLPKLEATGFQIEHGFYILFLLDSPTPVYTVTLALLLLEAPLINTLPTVYIDVSL